MQDYKSIKTKTRKKNFNADIFTEGGIYMAVSWMSAYVSFEKAIFVATSWMTVAVLFVDMFLMIID